MSKKQAVVIIGLLAAMLIGVAIVAGPGQSSGQNEVHLPIVVVDEPVRLSEAPTPTGEATSAITGNGAVHESFEITNSIVVTIDGVTVEMHPLYGLRAGVPITDGSSDPTPRLMAATQKFLEDNYKDSDAVGIPASGVTTKGGLIYVTGKSVQLPDNVQIDAFVVSLLCIPGKKCPSAPAYALKNIDTGNTVSISVNTGEIYYPSDADEDAKADFAWLVEALEVK